MTFEIEAFRHYPSTVIVDSKEYKEFHKDLQIDFIQSANAKLVVGEEFVNGF
jgi:hypothetical protein